MPYSMTESERALIDEITRGLRAELRANNEYIMLQLNQILTQTKETAKRVDKIEAETGIGRWFERNPVRFLILILGMALIGIEGLTSFLEKFIKLL